jgi:hypothetical protein
MTATLTHTPAEPLDDKGGWRLVQPFWLKTCPARSGQANDLEMPSETTARAVSVTRLEMQTRATAFAYEWQDEKRERAEKDSFWTGFLEIFGVSRKRVAVFEAIARKSSTGHKGFMDMLWPGYIAVEHKSRGQDLNAAMAQLRDYLPSLSESEHPVLAVVCDFETFRVHDLEKGDDVTFSLADLPKHLELFSFIAGYNTRHEHETEEDVNLKATVLLARLHDALKTDGYDGHKLRVFMVRILFILFADDTQVWERGLFDDYVRTRTSGSDLGPALSYLFQMLATPKGKRPKNLDEDLVPFEYINGNLFDENETLPIPTFNTKMREELLKCSRFDWSAISPAIFGSLFQNVMFAAERRALGAHYTTEANILRTIRPLFVEELEKELTLATSVPALKRFQDKLGSLTFFDPACGCGNFLVITYREIRRLETECVKRMRERGRNENLALDVRWESKVHVGQFYGIEIEEFPARIAMTAMQLMDHLANLDLSAAIGAYYVRFPITDTAHVHIGNALQVDWSTVLQPSACTYVFGNPPFVGKKARKPEQVADMDTVCSGIDGAGELDYVCAWYVKAATYIASTAIRVAFVSTNSIAQGEQVGILWRHLLSRNVSIRFAHRTFRWSNEARGNAHVYVVIIGFAEGAPSAGQRLPLFDYETPDSEVPTLVEATHINPYLIQHSDDTLLENRSKPLCHVPAIVFGNMPNDNSSAQKRIGGEGNLLLDEEERSSLLAREPAAKQFVRPFLSNDEWLNGKTRYCLWLVDASPADLRALPLVYERVQRVRAYRAASQRPATNRLADSPQLFGENRQPKNQYVLIPLHSSEHRRFIPMGFAEPSEITANSCSVIPDATLYHFGVLQSEMHMAWVRHVCGRLESRFRYSNTVVYNNYPWPETDESRQKAIAEAAQAVLDARAPFLKNGRDSLATIYDSNAMPQTLIDAHRTLSREVDRAYVPRRVFPTDRARMEFLLGSYANLAQQQLTLGATNKTHAKRPSKVRKDGHEES